MTKKVIKIKELVSHINDVRRQNPREDIVVVMHNSVWVETFKCMTSVDDADVYVRVDCPLEEITIVPRRLYFSNSFRK